MPRPALITPEYARRIGKAVLAVERAGLDQRRNPAPSYKAAALIPSVVVASQVFATNRWRYSCLRPGLAKWDDANKKWIAPNWTKADVVWGWNLMEMNNTATRAGMGIDIGAVGGAIVSVRPLDNLAPVLLCTQIPVQIGLGGAIGPGGTTGSRLVPEWTIMPPNGLGVVCA